MRCSHCWRLAVGDRGCLLGQLDDQAPQATMSRSPPTGGQSCLPVDSRICAGLDLLESCMIVMRLAPPAAIL